MGENAKERRSRKGVGMNIKKLKRVVVAGVFIAGLSVVGSNSFANPIDLKLPQGMLMVANNPSSIFVENGSKGIEKALLEKGVLKADIYQLQVKRENNFYYGVVGDVQLGSLAIGNLIAPVHSVKTTTTFFGKKQDAKESLELLKQVATGLEKIDDTGNLKFQYQEKTKTYEGVAKYHQFVGDDYYQNVLHVTLYQDRSYGPSVRFVALDAKHDAELYPELTKIMKVTK